MPKQQEMIGKVRLDYTWHPGEEIYSDGGEIEEHLLEIARNKSEEEFNTVIAEEKDWAVLYHMSHIRENIVHELPIGEDQTVLEIGAGCGAITGGLARRARSVTCIDLSRRRSMINAYRHRDLDNVEILVGNFIQIEETLTQKYDWITLIGVFEYGAGFISGDDPYGEFLRRIRRHLKKGGRLVIAIENRLGLKYWAGAREDHSGDYFDGLENYPYGGYARTFSKPELERILARNGFAGQEFFYPYPDYKLPSLIYSDSYLPQIRSLTNNLWNFDRDRLVLFSENRVFDSLIEDGLFPLFSNSFLVIAGEEKTEDTSSGRQNPDVPVFVKYSNDRCRRFSIQTEIHEETSGRRTVVKRASFPEGAAHVDHTYRSYNRLKELFGDTRIAVNEAEFSDGALVLEYVKETGTLADTAGTLWKAGRHEEAREVLRSLCSLIRSKASEPFTVTDEFRSFFAREDYPYTDKSLPVTDLDMIADNFLPNPDTGRWTLIDYEWTVEFPVPLQYVLFRIWHYFYAYHVDNDLYPEKEFLEEEEITWPEALTFLEMEQAWQDQILAGHAPLRLLYAQITPGSSVPQEVQHADRSSADLEGSAYFGVPKVTVSGRSENDPFREKVVRGIPLKIHGERFEVTLSTKGIGAVKYIRWDPVTNLMCRMRIEKIIAPVSLKIDPMNGFRNGDWDEFWSLDAAYLILGEIPDCCTITISGRIEIVQVVKKLPDMDAVRLERDAYAAKVQQLENYVTAVHGTKAFRMTEKLRSARNFMMARVRMIPGFRIKANSEADPKYQEWFAVHSASEQELMTQRMTQLQSQPLISILVPTWNTPEQYLRDMIDSVINQTYPNWELCIADASVSEGDGSRNEKIAEILKEYSGQDSRIRYVLVERNLGISGNTNRAAALATGEYVGLLDHDDILAPDALFEVAAAVNVYQPDVIYTDEDKIDMEGKFHFDPNLKPDFSPDLLRSHNYITHFFVARRSLLERVGYFRSEYDGAQDYDLILRCTECTENIRHIPKILYYWRNHPGSTTQNPQGKLYAYEAGTKAITDQLSRLGLKGSVARLQYWGLNHVRYETPGDPMISVIIPNKDHVPDLKNCLESILQKSSYRNFELLVVENNSTDPETFAYYEAVTKEYPQVRVIRWEGAFNYSAINNFGAEHAKGEVLLLLNNDTQLIEPDSLKEMLGLCLRRDVGCVGAKLLFADDTVQHCGIILGPGGFAGHVFSGQKDSDYGFMMRAQMTGNWSAVTAACMMVRKEVYDEVGGLTEDYAVALNDIDFCMKLREKQYLIVCTPFSKWYHFESKSRGYEDTPEKKERFNREVERFRSRWGAVVDAGDPYYNANLSVDRLPFSLW